MLKIELYLNRKSKYILYWTFICSVFYTACERKIDVKLPPREPQLVVEAYINSFDPRLNYVILTRSFSFDQNNFSIGGEKNASIYITEGSILGTDTIWNLSTRKQLNEIDSFPGLYFDISAFINDSSAVKGRQGYIYRLEIYTVDAKKILGYTYIPNAINIDSITFASSKSVGDTTYRMTINYNEPAARGSNYRLAYMIGGQHIFPFLPDSLPGLWGGFDDNKDFVFNDDIVNGVYRSVTLSGRVNVGDTINMYFNQMDRKSYQFWQSMINATNNGGPFSTPVTLESNITGAIGCFTGYGVYHKQLIYKK
jgi:hypothetical protein